MKKLFVTALLGLAAVSGWAQGTINFQNTETIAWVTADDRFVYLDRVGGTKLVGQNYVAGLFYSAGTLPSVAAGQITPNGVLAGATSPFRAPTTTSPGTWVPGSATRTLDGVGVGATAHVQVRVWDSQKFTSFAAAFAAGPGAGWGTSKSWDYIVPAGGSLPNTYYLNGLTAFALTVPEPSTIALGILGVASLLFLRRRK